MTGYNDGTTSALFNTTTDTVYTVNLQSGTDIHVAGSTYVDWGEKGNDDGKVSPRRKGKISATLYFKFVKSKLTKVDKEKLLVRVEPLKYLLDACEETEQEGLRDELLFAAADAVRRQQVAACGYDTIVSKGVEIGRAHV